MSPQTLKVESIRFLLAFVVGCAAYLIPILNAGGAQFVSSAFNWKTAVAGLISAGLLSGLHWFMTQVTPMNASYDPRDLRPAKTIAAEAQRLAPPQQKP